MKYKIRHYTEYTYAEPVSTCHNRLCLTPVNIPGHHACLSSEINIVPAPDDLVYRTDYFGNQLAFFSISQEHKRLRINATSMVNIESRANTDLAYNSTIRWEEARAALTPGHGAPHDIIQYTLPSMYIPAHHQAAKAFAADCFMPGTTLWEACHALMKKIHEEIAFKPGFTTVNTPIDTVLTLKKGVCQDFAHLMITCLRNLGLPARYVSGYIETMPPPGAERLVGADASHAWVGVYFPYIGWVEFDPTNCQLPSNKHVIVARGRDYQDIAPIKGIVFSGGEQKLTVRVDVERQRV